MSKQTSEGTQIGFKTMRIFLFLPLLSKKRISKIRTPLSILLCKLEACGSGNSENSNKHKRRVELGRYAMCDHKEVWTVFR